MPLNIASYIDHTILKQTTTLSEIDRLCVEASLENFVAVCVPPKYVPDVKKMLDGSKVKIATVIGFPMGYSTIEIKAKEIENAFDIGADEVDMVINLCSLKSGDWKYLENEIIACIAPVTARGKVIKVIVESGMLTDSELVAACELYSNYKIDYLKTSTGFADNGATVHAVELMRSHLPSRMGIKASGGVRNLAFAKELINAGATRIGSSASMQIMKESRGQQKN